MVSHANIIHNLSMLQYVFRHSEDSRIVSWLPFFHDWGLIGGLLQPIYSGVHCVLFDPLEFVRNPVSWLNVISKFSATVTGAPNFAYDRCVQTACPEDCAKLDLSGLDVAIVGAEPVRAETLDRFTSRFEECGFRRKSFFTSYGLAESTLLVTGGYRDLAPATIAVDRGLLEARRVKIRPDSASTDNVDRRLVSCGRTVLGQEVIIVDPKSRRPLGPGQIGEIWVSGPSIAQGYWDKATESREQFSASLSGESHDKGYLRTGDEGFLFDEELYVTGRIKDLIIVYGRNLYPEDIERIAADASPALRNGRGAAFSAEIEGAEQLIVVHEAEYGGDWDGEDLVQKLRQAVVAIVGVVPYAVALVKAGGIPTTSSGKIRRQACKRLFLDEKLPCLHEWRKASGRG